VIPEIEIVATGEIGTETGIGIGIDAEDDSWAVEVS
jgi:hypothetical protein